MLGERIQELLGQAGISTRTTRRSVVCDCPDCQGDHKLYILKTSAQNKCMKCSKRWSPSGLLSVLLQVSQVEASVLLYNGGAPDLAAALVVDFDEDSDLDSDDSQVETMKVIKIDPLFLNPSGTPGETYLAGRGVTDINLIRSHDLRYSAVMNGIVFIIRNPQGEPVGTQTRFINPWNPKLRMLTSEGLQKGKLLYNYIAIDCEKKMIVSEGPFDCLKCDVPGYTSVATLGKGVTQDQIDIILASKADTVYLALDRDAANEVNELAMKLAHHKQVFRMVPPEHRKDFGDCNTDEVLSSIEIAQPCQADKTARLEVFMK